MEPGTKVMIEAVVIKRHDDGDYLVQFKSKNKLWIAPSDLTVCEKAEVIDREILNQIYLLFENLGAKSDILSTIGSYKDTQSDEATLWQLQKLNSIYGKPDMKPIDLNNFAIDITNPVNAELLPGFKEWLIKNGHENIQDYFESHRYFGRYKNTAEVFGSCSLHNGTPVHTLPELQKQHPGVFENVRKCEGCGESTDGALCETCYEKALCNGRPVPTPSFKAGQEPKDLCAVKTDGTIVCHPYDLGEVITPEECKFIGSWQECLGHIRPIPAQPTVENPEEELKTILNNAYRKGEWGSYLDQEILAWHQKHSGRVEVSVPSEVESTGADRKEHNDDTECICITECLGCFHKDRKCKKLKGYDR